MGALSHFLSQICAMTTIFLTILLLEVIVFVRSSTRELHRCNRGPITTARYLQLIEEKNPSVRFRRGPGALDPLECSVCLSLFEEGEEIRKLKCSHTFHKACLDTWLQQYRATCPLCRSKVLPEEIIVRYRQRLNFQEHDGRDEDLVFFLSALHGTNLHRLL